MAIIGVTDEELDIVEPWIKLRSPGYPIVVLPDRALEEALKVDAFPCQAVIDPDGNIAYSDGFGRKGSSQPLSEALDKAKKGPIWPRKFSKVAELIAADQFDKSWAELAKVLEGQGEFAPDEQAAADKLKAYLESLAVDAAAAGQTAFSEGRVYDAHRTVGMFAHADPPLTATPDCAKLLAELEALPEFKDEMKAGEKYAEGMELERAGKYADAFKAYKGIGKSFPLTKMGGVATTSAQSLIDRNLPGYERSCSDCRTGKQACPKHLKKLKL